MRGGNYSLRLALQQPDGLWMVCRQPFPNRSISGLSVTREESGACGFSHVIAISGLTRRRFLATELADPATSVLPTIRLEVVGIRHPRMDVEIRGCHLDKLPARLRT